MSLNQVELRKNIALLEELDTSAKLIKLGFGELQNLNASNDFHFLTFQLLSQGFERLMKSYICLAYFEIHQSYPDYKYIKDLGHDLEALLDKILTEFYYTKNHPILLTDKTFLNTDPNLKELLVILSEFGKYARYYNFDILTGSQKPSVDSKLLWVKFRNRILFSNSSLSSKILDEELSDELYGDLSRYTVITLEKYVFSLCRQFNFGGIGERAKGFSSSVFDFSLLYPNNYGNTNYRINTTRYKETPKKVHKRNWKDRIERKFNSNYKWQKIKKAEYSGDWPFYSEVVIIECRHKNWCVITIEGHDYALNGSAKGRYKLENPTDAGRTILGKGLSDFISMALNLAKTK